MILLLKNTQPQTFLCENINAKMALQSKFKLHLSKLWTIKGILKFAFVIFVFLWKCFNKWQLQKQRTSIHHQ